MDARDMWLEEAIERWEMPLLRFCYAQLNDMALAEDAVQETFVKAYRGYAGFRGDSQEKTWLLRIALNTCRDMRRSAWSRHVDRTVTLDDVPQGEAVYTPWDDTLTRAVMALPHKLREVVLLHYYHELTVPETGAVLHMARSTVYYRLEKAHALLRKEMEGWQDE